MTTKLIETERLDYPARDDCKVKFTREDDKEKRYTIHACTCYESWQQWGAPKEVLGDNVDDVEEWRRSLDE